MLENYFGYIVLGILGILIAGVFTIIGVLLGPKSNNRVKSEPFETGLAYIPSKKNVHVKFYLVAMVFLIFDVEVALLYPYALLVEELSWSGFIVAAILIFILLVGILYEYKRRILDY